MKYAVVDFRMRAIEKDFLRNLGYTVIDNGFNINVYDEVSSHVDIYYAKVGNVVFAAPEKRNLLPFNVVCCTTPVGGEYPLDVPYNVCVVGNNVLHNFKHTDTVLKMYLEGHGYNLINVEQGYTNCSTVVLDDNSCKEDKTAQVDQ